MNGQVVHTVYRDVVVNRPVVTSTTPSGWFEIQAGWGHFFTATHTGESLTWSVSPSTGAAIGQMPNGASVIFGQPGHYTVSVTSSNACGCYTRHIDVTVIGDLNPVLLCPRCGFFFLNCICMNYLEDTVKEK